MREHPTRTRATSVKTKMKTDQSGLLSSVESTSVCYLALSGGREWSVFSHNITLLAESSANHVLASSMISGI